MIPGVPPIAGCQGVASLGEGYSHPAHVAWFASRGGGGARWFVRLYGEMRQPGKRHTVAIAQDEISCEERSFQVDPRLRTLHEAPVQLQLGVEGVPGAFAVFEDVAFLLPANEPTIRLARSFRAGRKTFRPSSGCRTFPSRSRW
jgi:hypothetical protein